VLPGNVIVSDPDPENLKRVTSLDPGLIGGVSENGKMCSYIKS